MNISHLTEAELDTDAFDREFPLITLFRGSETELPEHTKIPFKFREKSMSIIPLLNYLLNVKLEEKYGLPIRNLLYCTTDYDQADIYGKVYTVKPLGTTFRMFYVGGFRDLYTKGKYRIDDDRIIDHIETMRRQDGENITDFIYDHDKIFSDVLDSTSLEKAEQVITSSELPMDDMTKTAWAALKDSLEQSVAQIMEDYDVKEITEDTQRINGEIMCYFPEGFVVKKSP